MLMSCTVKIAASMAIRCAGEVQGKQRRAEATLQKPAVAAAGIKCCDNCIESKLSFNVKFEYACGQCHETTYF